MYHSLTTHLSKPIYTIYMITYIQPHADFGILDVYHRETKVVIQEENMNII